MLYHDVFVNICYRCANICKVRTINICYVMFLLTVCWAMNIYVKLTCYMYYRVPFYTRTTFIQKQTIQDFQPTNRQRINISQVLAGRFMVFLCFLFLFMLSFEFCCFCLCFYMCLFDCKCKSLKRLGENIKKTKINHKETYKKTKKTKN